MIPYFYFIWNTLCGIHVVLIVGIVMQSLGTQPKLQHIRRLFQTYLNESDNTLALIEENTVSLKGPEGLRGIDGTNGENGTPGTFTGVPVFTRVLTLQIHENASGTTLTSGTWQQVKMGQFVINQQLGDIATPTAVSSIFTTVHVSGQSTLYDPLTPTLFPSRLRISSLSSPVRQGFGSFGIFPGGFDWQYTDGTSSITNISASSVAWIANP
jgi:hypothetical protein